MGLKTKSEIKRKSNSYILKAYEDRVFKLNQKELFLLLHDIRFYSERIYHRDGGITLKVCPDIADQLESIFEDI